MNLIKRKRMAREHCLDASLGGLVDQIEVIQSNLLDIGSNIATPISSSNQARLGLITRHPIARHRSDSVH